MRTRPSNQTQRTPSRAGEAYGSNQAQPPLEILVCGDDVRELLHDGHPTACVTDAAFAYVNAFNAHVNVGFFRGAALPDPGGLLEGTGRFMRHVKLRPGAEVDAVALRKLIDTAHKDMQQCLEAG
tara:strand:+ start:1115 stop:1489 length:375 start_codon:yes stop_codon:yes gene_type:complete